MSMVWHGLLAALSASDLNSRPAKLAAGVCPPIHKHAQPNAYCVHGRMRGGSLSIAYNMSQKCQLKKANFRPAAAVDI